ncbi:hypothetical protein [Candidatus Uabimicrobium amorphum]|uniref:DUF5667 domain-containing protein n=1 Tax=Uabimicrobium amorphum TaxID=2596890 RepID=A0A5S9F478_UABAM|nr:hypothetical protein [Candidatus Uabimicrobium amorphum]BBM85476.1 hypothetical protein UABAM_03845 [Candidatus Uabimicrobium amorphum]
MAKNLRLLAILCLLICVSNSYAQKYDFKFDLITCDRKSKYLHEPDGELTVSMALPRRMDKKDLQKLQKAGEKQLRSERYRIEREMLAFNEEIDEVNFLSRLSYKEVSELEDEANDKWEQNRSLAQRAVKRALEKEWKNLQKNKSMYKRHRFKVAFRISSNVVAIASSLAAIFSSGGTNIAAYASLVSSTASLGGNMKNAGSDVFKNATEVYAVLIQINSIAKKIKAAKEKGVSDRKMKRLEDELSKARKSLSKKADAYRSSLGEIEIKAEKLQEQIEAVEKKRKSIPFDKMDHDDTEDKVKKIDDTLDEMREDLEELQEKLEEAEKLTEKVDQLSEIDKSIDGFGSVSKMSGLLASITNLSQHITKIIE